MQQREFSLLFSLVSTVILLLNSLISRVYIYFRDKMMLIIYSHEEIYLALVLNITDDNKTSGKYLATFCFCYFFLLSLIADKMIRDFIILSRAPNHFIKFFINPFMINRFILCVN